MCDRLTLGHDILHEAACPSTLDVGMAEMLDENDCDATEGMHIAANIRRLGAPVHLCGTWVGTEQSRGSITLTLSS